MCEHEKAIVAYNYSINLESLNLSYRWSLMNTFPIIYQNNKEINNYNKKFINNINSINEFLDSNNSLTKENLIDGICNSTNFYLHYQGINNLKIQKKYAKLIERITKKIYPDFYKKRNNPILKKIKIGFVSSTCFTNHSVSDVVKNWIFKINDNFFEIFIYHVSNELDKITKSFKKNFNNFYNNTNIDELINKIYKDELNIIVYPDIGMESKIQILASLRLSPIQCQAWGHPVSSCFHNIDYFISSEFMEINKPKEEYAEKLIKLSNTSQYYDWPKIKFIQKKTINKKNKIFFFCLQNLYKLLSNDDYLYLQIIKKNPNCEIWFMEGTNTSITNSFKKRLKKLLDKENININKNIFFHKRLSQKKFYKLIYKSDIVLDSLNWSGNCTSHQAIALDKPVVTFPGKYMRARHSYAILKQIKLKELIAKSIQDYVEIVTKLAKDNIYRELIIKKINKNKKILFEDMKPIKDLEKFFLSCIKK